ncbi:MAG: gamma-glutamyltransferase family protein, partial [bacterium]
ETYRPPVMGATHMVSSGHYLAAAAGYRILEQGGNAIDAGVASGIAINVTLPHATGFGGVAPIAIYHAASDEVVTISGLGRWPRAASIDYLMQNAGGQIPLGHLRSVTPAAADAWLTALEHYGTMTFEQVVTPAVELAELGFPLSAVVQRSLGRSEETMEGDLDQWESTREVFMPNGRVPEVGEPLVQKDLARTFRRLIEVEKASSHKGREAAIRAARDYFYKGDIAEEMAGFSQRNGGLLTLEDLKEFSVKIEKPEVGQFRDFSIYTCGPWCQGPVVAQTLQMLENDDLAAMGHNSPDYIHLVSQALNLSFADRHYYYGDPDYVDVPMEGLLSSEYTRARRSAIDMDRAFQEMPPPGEPWAYQGRADKNLSMTQKLAPVPGEEEQDTSYTCVVDRWGNAFSATPSDGLFGSPIVPGLGFLISSRGSQSWLDPDHASSLQPWKRPRLTPNPAIAFKKGKLFMPFGTPGGDAQCPAMVQMFLNIAEFGMNPQAAIEQPRFVPWNYPNSFWPHTYLPGRLHVEGRISGDSNADLESRGHDLRALDDWSPAMGALSGIVVDQSSGALKAGADPRRDTYAIGR